MASPYREEAVAHFLRDREGRDESRFALTGNWLVTFEGSVALGDHIKYYKLEQYLFEEVGPRFRKQGCLTAWTSSA